MAQDRHDVAARVDEQLDARPAEPVDDAPLAGLLQHVAPGRDEALDVGVDAVTVQKARVPVELGERCVGRSDRDGGEALAGMGRQLVAGAAQLRERDLLLGLGRPTVERRLEGGSLGRRAGDVEQRDGSRRRGCRAERLEPVLGLACGQAVDDGDSGPCAAAEHDAEHRVELVRIAQRGGHVGAEPQHEGCAARIGEMQARFAAPVR